MNLRNMVVLAYLRDHPSVAAADDRAPLDGLEHGVLVLNDLEDLEYAERRRDPADRRRHIVDITAAGLEALERAEMAQGSTRRRCSEGSAWPSGASCGGCC